MSHEDFNGYASRELKLPDRNRIVCYYFQPNGCKDVSPYDLNHNIFRLDAQGQVVWQVTRDEGAVDEGFGDLRRAMERGEINDKERARWLCEPFTGFELIHADGSSNRDLKTERRPDIAVWQPGDRVRTSTTSGWPYVLDIETGIALNTATGSIRPW